MITRNREAAFFDLTLVLVVLRYTSMSSAPESCSLVAFLPAATAAASVLSASSRHAFTSSISAASDHAVSWFLKSLTNACTVLVSAVYASSQRRSPIAPRHWQCVAKISSNGAGTLALHSEPRLRLRLDCSACATAASACCERVVISCASAGPFWVCTARLAASRYWPRAAIVAACVVSLSHNNDSTNLPSRPPPFFLFLAGDGKVGAGTHTRPTARRRQPHCQRSHTPGELGVCVLATAAGGSAASPAARRRAA
mmetsp:Transcript_21085/g.52428  ORF Transcript_21085/g.52428 Transcript_21085/m.52428 type:complete len:255 (+) Transcript_21085:838-1602(+)